MDRDGAAHGARDSDRRHLLHAAALGAFMLLPVIAVIMALVEPRVLTRRASGAVRDMTGAPVPLAGSAKRALIFPPVLPAYLTVDEGSGHLAAAVTYQRTDIQSGLLRYVYPAAVQLPNAATLGYNTAIPGDPEQIVALDADAVFSWAHFSGSLAKIGTPVVRLRLDPRANDGNSTAVWRLIGSVSGKQSRVEWLAERYARERERVLASLRDITRRPRVLYVYQTQPLIVAFGGTTEDRMLTAVRATNVAGALSGPALSIEELLLLAPDIIIVAGNGPGNEIQTLYDDPALGELPAVRTRQIYRQPTGGARMAGLVEEPLMLQWLAEVLHPGEVPASFRRDLKATYAAVYGVALSDDAIDATLHVDQHAGASGFERFLAPTRTSARGN